MSTNMSEFKNNYFINPESGVFPILQYANDKFSRNYAKSGDFSLYLTESMKSYFLGNSTVINERIYFYDRQGTEVQKSEYVFERDNLLFTYEEYPDSQRLVTVFAKTGRDIEDFRAEVIQYKKVFDRSNINAIIKNGNSLQLSSLDFKGVDVDIEDNYNDDFLPIYDKLKFELEVENGRGLFCLHGTPGTGKTKFLTKLAKEVKDKKFIFIPPQMVDILTSPDFIPFIMGHPNSIILIEEAEQVLCSRDLSSGRSTAVSNLLNLTDGILADSLKVQLICTFNNDYNKIDKALLRKGRLKIDYEFHPLSIEKSNKLLKKLGSQFVTKEPMTLADIYNIDEDNNLEVVVKNPIGF